MFTLSNPLDIPLYSTDVRPISNRTIIRSLSGEFEIGQTLSGFSVSLIAQLTTGQFDPSQAQSFYWKQILQPLAAKSPNVVSQRAGDD
jgi:hypothetical protein